MEDDQPYDVVLDDELQWSCVPRASAPDDEMAAATEEKRHQRFIDTWTEKGGIPPRGPYNQEEEEAAAADDDDIGAHFVTTDRHLANANRDIGRLLDNACAVVTAAGLPHPPDMATGYRLVLLDRARRIAMGTARPPPMSLTQGLDGGVNRTPSRRRRPRPRPSSQQDVMSRKGGRRADMLPRRRGDTGHTVCVGVRPNQFDWRRDTVEE